jgi:sugar O-acyltransferase (sialic acid O-acetyltransferase NeuD family)
VEEILIFGAGGHAKVVFDVIKRQGLYKPVAFVTEKLNSAEFQGIACVEFAELSNLEQSKGVVAIGDNYTRCKVVEQIKSVRASFQFVSVIDPFSSISDSSKVGQGSVVIGKSFVNVDVKIGSHVILNSSCSVDHDSVLGDFSSIAPGAVLGGNVKVGQRSSVGLGASLIHSVTVGEDTVIGAGSTVVNSIADRQVAYGVPCKVIRSREPADKYL